MNYSGTLVYLSILHFQTIDEMPEYDECKIITRYDGIFFNITKFKEKEKKAISRNMND